MRLDDPPNWGSLLVRFVEAQYDEQYVEGTPHTYCCVWLLEKVRWRRRKCRPRGRGPGEDPMHPSWGDEYEFADVRDDSKVAIDVWNVGIGGAADEFYGKVWLQLSDVIRKPISAWHDLVPGRVQVYLEWTPYVDDTLGHTIALTLPPSKVEVVPAETAPPKVAVVAPPKAMAPPPLPQPVEEVVSAPLTRATGTADEVEEIEEIEEMVEIQAAPARVVPPVPVAPPKPAAAPAIPLEYYEYTHRGGTGHGPKENQVLLAPLAMPRLL